MIKQRTFIFGAFVLAVFVGIAAKADSSSSSWSDLTDEPSRADLFRLVIAAAEAEQKDLPPPVALPGPFLFPEHTTYDFELNMPRNGVLFGIDISHHNGSDIKFDTLAAQNVKFVYAKATQGVGFKDKRFAEYWSAIDALPKEQKLLRGAYHFLSAADDGPAQAQSFLNFLSASGGLTKEEMPPVVDLEWDVAKPGDTDRWSAKSPDEIISSVLGWLKLVQERTGRVPMVYTTRSWWRQRVGSEESFSRLSPYRLWIADYSDSARGKEAPHVPANSKWHLWQFTEQAQVKASYPRRLDASIFKGSDGDFEQVFQVKLK
jgi:lysozyme